MADTTQRSTEPVIWRLGLGTQSYWWNANGMLRGALTSAPFRVLGSSIGLYKVVEAESFNMYSGLQLVHADEAKLPSSAGCQCEYVC